MPHANLGLVSQMHIQPAGVPSRAFQRARAASLDEGATADILAPAEQSQQRDRLATRWHYPT